MESKAKTNRTLAQIIREPLACVPKSLRLAIRIATLTLLVYWVALFIATHLPRNAIPQLHQWDKLYHAIAFAGLSFLLAWAVPKSSRSWAWHSAIVCSTAIVYGCIDELSQRLIPGRTCDVYDVLADAVGAFIGYAAYLLCRTALLRLDWGRRFIFALSR